MAYQNQKVKARQVVTQPNTQTDTLGITTNVPMGDWQANIEYKKLNMVRSHNATYQAKKNNQGAEPTVTTGWQEIWQVVAYDGNILSDVVVNGTYPEMTVGNAINAQNDGTGQNIAEQFTNINEKIPSTASADNQLADKAFVNSSINAMAAFYITYNENGDAFPARADLLNATTFYSGGQPRVPTQNDYAIVLADESQLAGVDGSYPTTRYSYQGGTYPNGQWDFQYIVNNTSLTQAQVNAINSGITATIVGKIASPSTTTPLMDGTASVGTSNNYAKGDHRHPTNTAGRTFTGNIVAPQVTGLSGVYDGSNRVWSNDNRPTATQYQNTDYAQNQTDTVIEYYRASDGSSWYRIWASGWKECGGLINGSGTLQLALPTPFNSANYTIVATYNAFGNTSPLGVVILNKTSTGFQLRKWYGSDNGSAGEQAAYYACGY